VCHCLSPWLRLPGTESLADELADADGADAADGDADADDVPEPVFTTTFFSVPFAAVTVMPSEGLASWLPPAGVIWMAAAASEARDTGVAALFALVLWCPPPLEQAASTRPRTASTAAPAGLPSHRFPVPLLPRTLILHGLAGLVWPALSDWPCLTGPV
jgi:hypothetical protein